MTEEEAKTKWCPMVQVRPGRTDSGFFEPVDNRHAFCIGHLCMMWRVYRVPNGKPITLQAPDGIITVAHGITGSDEHGCCGLAGMP